VGKPYWLSKAELIDSLCQRYGCLPSQLLKEDAEILLIAGLANDGQAARDGEK
tara:strand:+ start:1055 stop:1213 length:159 start_codon:yes stop_codon:yes gene_type:complete